MKKSFVGRGYELNQIQDIWRRVEGRDGSGPHVVVLKGERGSGKTSLVGEFYRQIASGNPEGSYWPATLTGVNPSFKSYLPGKGTRPDFLWWGLKFAPELRAFDSYLPDLEPHLKHMYDARIRRSIGANASALAIETAISLAGNFFTGGALSVLTALASTRDFYDAYKLKKDSDAQRGHSRTNIEGRKQQSFKEQNDVVLTDFKCLFDEPNKDILKRVSEVVKNISLTDMPSIPMVLFLDQVEHIDERTYEFLRCFLGEAGKKSWPIMAVLTRSLDCEDQQSHRIDSMLESISDSSIHRLNLGALSSLDARIVWEENFPGMTEQQVVTLSEKVDGNPQLMWEVVGFLNRNHKWFENRSLSSPLTDRGLAKVKRTEFELHSLVRARIEEMGELVADVIGLSSYQGTQFVDSFVADLARKLFAPTSDEDPAVALRTAQSPLQLIEGVGDEIFEFCHSTYYEVAKGFLSDLKDENPDLSESVSRALIEKLTHSEAPGGSFQAAELLSRLALHVLPVCDAVRFKDRFQIQLARTRALAYLAIGEPSSHYPGYQEELMLLIKEAKDDPAAVCDYASVVEHTLSFKFKFGDDAVEGREEAFACLVQVIKCYLLVEAPLTEASAVRLLKSLRLLSSASKRTVASAYLLVEDWDSDGGKRRDDHVRTWVAEQLDDIQKRITEHRYLRANYVGAAATALIAYGKELIGCEERGAKNKALERACRLCIDERAPKDLVAEILSLAVWELSLNSRGFVEHSVAYLEGVWKSGEMTPRLIGAYRMLIEGIKYSKSEYAYLAYKNCLMMYVEEALSCSYEEVRPELLRSVYSLTREGMSHQQEKQSVFDGILESLKGLLDAFHSQNHYAGLLDIAREVSSALVRCGMDSATDLKQFVHDVSGEVFVQLGISRVLTEDWFDRERFEGRIALGYALTRLGFLMNYQGFREEKVGLLKQLVDGAPKFRDAEVSLVEEWSNIEKIFEGYSKNGVHDDVMHELDEYISLKLVEANDDASESERYLSFLFSLQISRAVDRGVHVELPSRLAQKHKRR